MGETKGTVYSEEKIFSCELEKLYKLCASKVQWWDRCKVGTPLPTKRHRKEKDNRSWSSPKWTGFTSCPNCLLQSPPTNITNLWARIWTYEFWGWDDTDIQSIVRVIRKIAAIQVVWLWFIPIYITDTMVIKNMMHLRYKRETYGA